MPPGRRSASTSCHLNLHKTFATPHGGGGPGAGPVGVVEKLAAVPARSRASSSGDDGTYYLDYDAPKTIGYIAPFYGNFGVILRAYAYMLMLGREGLREVERERRAQRQLRPGAAPAALRRRRRPAAACTSASSAAGARPRTGVHALDIAKALIDRGFHPPTVYFPLIVPEAIMIEPTETEASETLDRFCDAMIELAGLAEREPDALRRAPRGTPVGRLDEVAAARGMDLAFPEAAAAGGAGR